MRKLQTDSRYRSVIRKFIWLSIIAFFVLSFDSSQVFPENIDQRLYTILHDTYRSRIMDFTMREISDLMTPQMAFGLCLMFFIYGSRYLKDTTKLTFASLVISGSSTEALKVIVDRHRPNGAHYSFPSGHATGAFAVATLLSARYPKYSFIFYSTAGVVGYSRIYLGKHYPADVLAGGLIGYLTSYILASTIKAMYLPEDKLIT